MKRIHNKQRKTRCLFIILLALTFVIELQPLGAENGAKNTKSSGSNVDFWPVLDSAIGASYGSRISAKNNNVEKGETKPLALIRSGLGAFLGNDDNLLYYSKLFGEFNFSNDGAKYLGFDLRSGAAVGAIVGDFIPIVAIDVGATWSLIDFNPRPTTFLSISLPILVVVQLELQHDWATQRFGTLLKLWVPLF